MTIEQNKKLSIVSIIIVSIVLLSLFYCFYHRHIPFSSDSTTLLPVAQDILNGNIFMRDWIVGSNNFVFSEILFYCAGLAWGLSKLVLLTVIPSLFLACFIVIFSYTFVFFDKTLMSVHAVLKMILCLFYILLVGIIPLESGYTLLNANSHNNLYLFVVFCVICVFYFLEKNSKSWLISYSALLFLLSFSEDVTIMILSGPVVAFCLYHLIYGRLPPNLKTSRKNYLILLGTTLLYALLGKLACFFLASYGGLVTRGIPLRLILSPAKVWERIISFFPQLSVLFGYHVQDGLGFGSLLQFQNTFICIVMICWAISFIAGSLFFYRLSFFDKFLILISIANLCGCFFTDVAVFHRYIVPAYLFGMLFMLKCLLRMIIYCVTIIIKKKTFIRNTICIALFGIFGVCCSITSYRRIHIMRTSRLSDGQDELKIVEIIQAKGFGDGYGDFWCASMPSFYSDFNIKIYPIYALSNSLSAWPELVKRTWYEEQDKHFIIMPTPPSTSFINYDDMVKILGVPDDSFSQGRYSVYYWQKDISPYIKHPES